MANVLPQSNARLTKVEAPGFSDDADLPETAGAAKWTGNSQAYYREQVVTSTAQMSGAGKVDLLRKTTLIIPGNLRPSVEVAVQDRVYFTIKGVAKVREVREVSAPVMVGALPTIRLFLEDA